MSRPAPDQLAPNRPAPRRYPPAGLAVRLVIVLAGVAVLAIPAERHLVWASLTVAGVLVAATSPERAGAGLALGAAIGSWLAAYGVHGTPPLASTAAFALALYLLHTSTALAAAIPLSARLRGPVLSRWLRRCSVQLAVAAVLGAASHGLGRPDSSSALHLLGLLGVLLLVAVPALLLNRPD